MRTLPDFKCKGGLLRETTLRAYQPVCTPEAYFGSVDPFICRVGHFFADGGLGAIKAPACAAG